MINRGVATFTLDSGKCPKWLFDRMTILGREMARVLIEEYGSDEFIRRIADPVWFQSFGTVLAFDWNASGLTTILTAALKEAMRGYEREYGIYICGGKGKTSLKTPEEIRVRAHRAAIGGAEAEHLVTNSRMSAKVDSALVQDGFQLYHHAFFFSKNGAWAVVQQGMNKDVGTARRYHWHSERAGDLIEEPHSGIASQATYTHVLDMTARKSAATRVLSTELVGQQMSSLQKDIEILRKHSTAFSRMVRLKQGGAQLTLLELEDKEFHYHPVVQEDFSKSKYLEKILTKLTDQRPKSYAALLGTEGVGPKTIRALTLVAEVIYGARPSYEDPARYSFAHGGKDATPYPVDKTTYDQSIAMLTRAIRRTRISPLEKDKAVRRLLS